MHAKRDKKKEYGLLRYVDGKYFSTVYFDSYDEAYIDALRYGEENCVIQHYDEYGCVVSQDVFKDMPTPY